MVGSIKIIGVNSIYQDWMGKEFENCELRALDPSIHALVIPEKEAINLQIYKTSVLESSLVFESMCTIDGDMGRIAIEFTPNKWNI